MSGTMDEVYPLYPTAVVVPVLAFPAWILCLVPVYWHFSQRNIAAGSLVLWMTMINFFNFINPLIWPRDNVKDWWNGNVFCDIQIHIRVCTVVAMTSCTAVIARKLARVMDTRNITIAPSKNSLFWEKVFEIWWCWGFPLVLMAFYYIIQPARYFIFAIKGCVAAYDTSWPSIVISHMWNLITTLIGAFYAGLLIFRLYRYRREVHSLIAARNTTKSRFVRLFIMSTVFLAVFLPYNTYILAVLATTAKDPYDWDYIHGDNWNVIIKVPTAGSVRFDVWGTIACGYLFFFLFGTGVDANNTYKRLLCAVGLGKIFPSLYIPSESVSRTSSTPSFAKGFASSCASKAKSLFSKRGSVTESYPGNSFNDSICLTNSSGQSNHIATNDPILVQDTHRSSFKDIFGRVFHRPNTRAPLLPVFNTRSLGQESASDKSPVKSIPPGVHARAWALQAAAHDRTSSEDGVHIVHEVHQAHDEMDQTKKQTDVHDWA